MNELTKDQVTIGRLRRKIERLITQREYHKQQHTHYNKVIGMQPYIERRYEQYQDRLKEQSRIKDMEKRVKEQEILIGLLTGTKLQHYEIDALYSKLIKEEYRKLNEK